MHCLRLLHNCEKWRKHWKTLARAGRTNVDDVSNSKGRPMVTKKSETAVVAGEASEWVATSIDKVLTDVYTNSTIRRAEKDKRWDTLM